MNHAEQNLVIEVQVDVSPEVVSLFSFFMC